ncbi:hypothetical protein [Pseudomonas carassii]|uniref:Uncharacterized protein n=1 Tax=Pseudomonas carassii TaxID=3115855 RepID=A0ABU7HFZ4_9PSED|nr:hypothetical protein [Pseudomonas sp. 137P]MEE1890232.1 hypothetical protein [Pseudomonas sp. 137P]
MLPSEGVASWHRVRRQSCSEHLETLTRSNVGGFVIGGAMAPVLAHVLGSLLITFAGFTHAGQVNAR